MKISPLLLAGILSLTLLACKQETTDRPPTIGVEAETTTQDFFLEQGALIGMHYAIHKPDGDVQAGRNFLRYEFFPNWKGLFPGSEAYYLRPDRGPHLGTEGFLWVFQDREARNDYFPEKDFPSEKFEEIQRSVDWLYKDTTFFRHFQYGLNSSGYSSDYEVIAMTDTVDREWLSQDAALVFRHYQLRPNADSLAFESFLRDTWAPAKSRARQDALVAFLKVIRGYREGAYSQLFVFKDIPARNEAFPYGGGEASRKEPDAIEEQLHSYLEPAEQEDGHYELIY